MRHWLPGLGLGPRGTRALLHVLTIYRHTALSPLHQFGRGAPRGTQGTSTRRDPALTGGPAEEEEEEEEHLLEGSV